MRQIVVGVDGSTGAAQALRWAVEEARLRDLEVRAVLGWALQGRPRELDERLRDVRFTYHGAVAAEALHEAVADAVGDEPPVKIHEIAIYAPPVDALLDESLGAEMLVVGTRGPRPPRRLPLGSVAATCAYEAQVPLVVVRDLPEAPAGTRRSVLVGVDGSPASLAALRWAADEAERRGTGLRIVHAWQLPAPLAAGHDSDLQDLVREAAHVRLQRAVAEGLGDRLRSDHRADLVAGPAARVLTAAALDAQLLVVGARGTGAFPEQLIGSTSHQCVVHAPGPVAVIRDPRAA